jgi:hypothetical protein
MFSATGAVPGALLEVANGLVCGPPAWPDGAHLASRCAKRNLLSCLQPWGTRKASRATKFLARILNITKDKVYLKA